MLLRLGVTIGLFTVGIVAGSQAATQGACGVDRWPVKVLADSDRALIDTVPIVSTIAELNSIPIPEIPYPNARRIPPHELRTYRVSGVVAQVLVEDDRDWHIVLRDEEAPSLTMIVEIPAPECASVPADAERYEAARVALRGVPRAGVVEVTGVGFFDFIHNQRGRARNGFELHPVLTISRRHETLGSK